MFTVFTRTWWKENADWPDGLEPEAGPRTTIGYAKTEDEARTIAQDYNKNNKPGRLSRKAEFTNDIKNRKKKRN